MSENRIFPNETKPQTDKRVSFRKNQKVHIRWMIRRDMPDVLSIENQCSDYPWDEEKFLHYLRLPTCIGMVAEVDDTIVGFMVYDLQKKRLEIINLATYIPFHRMGIGRQMIDKLKGKLSEHGRRYLLIYVRETSLNVQNFLKVNGFKARRVEREHFDDSGEDAYVMRYILK